MSMSRVPCRISPASGGLFKTIKIYSPLECLCKENYIPPLEWLWEAPYF
jgi:hypothetical protein